MVSLSRHGQSPSHHTRSRRQSTKHLLGLRSYQTLVILLLWEADVLQELHWGKTKKNQTQIPLNGAMFYTFLHCIFPSQELQRLCAYIKTQLSRVIKTVFTDTLRSKYTAAILQNMFMIHKQHMAHCVVPSPVIWDWFLFLYNKTCSKIVFCTDNIRSHHHHYTQTIHRPYTSKPYLDRNRLVCYCALWTWI